MFRLYFKHFKVLSKPKLDFSTKCVLTQHYTLPMCWMFLMQSKLCKKHRELLCFSTISLIVPNCILWSPDWLMSFKKFPQPNYRLASTQSGCISSDSIWYYHREGNWWCIDEYGQIFKIWFLHQECSMSWPVTVLSNFTSE